MTSMAGTTRPAIEVFAADEQQARDYLRNDAAPSDPAVVLPLE